MFRRQMIRTATRAMAPQSRKLGFELGGIAAAAGAGPVAPLVFGLAVGAVGTYVYDRMTRPLNWNEVRDDVVEMMEDLDWDDGSWGPVFCRLAWHSSGTYSKKDHTGGSDGATMRFGPEAGDGANAGLEHARTRLEKIYKKYGGKVSHADLWVLASCVAIEYMGGPTVPFHPGRSDAASAAACPVQGRLPDAALNAKHIRDVFGRMGFTDQEMVALIGGGHTIGRCHRDRSGYDGPWTRAPTTFSNLFFQELLNRNWTVKKWDGPLQYEDESGDLMMLPTDMELKFDPEFRKWVDLYAKDERRFFNDFKDAYVKLLELGCDDLQERTV
ncbi:MAG: hypothetical protein MHM6MM_006464 [Cercozoa sp. M6MM]